MKRIMHKFKMTEISAVDRPAQAHAKSVIMKRADDDFISPAEAIWKIGPWMAEGTALADVDGEAAAYFVKRFFSAEARRKDAKSGVAMKDGSFPISSEEDLRNAERLAGHAKNPSAARAHIRSRAKALGLTSHMSKSQEETTMDAIAKALGLAEGATEADVVAAIAANVEKAKRDSKRDNEKGDTMSEKDDRDGTEADPDAPQEATPRKMKKNEAELKKALDDAEELRKRNDDMAKRLATLEDEREQAAFAKRAVALGLPEAHGEVIRKAYANDKDAIGKLEEIIKGLTSQVATGDLFKEFGTSRGGDATSAESVLKSKADEYKAGQVKIGKKCSDAQAFTAVYTDAANADLKKRYDEDQAIAKRRVA